MAKVVTPKTLDLSATKSTRLNWLDLAFYALVIAGIIISGYLTWTHLTETSIICTADHSCDTVNQSAYAYFPPSVSRNSWGIPVAYLGFVVYIGLAALSILRWKLAGYTLEERRNQVDLAIFALTLGGVLFSAYLTAMELWVIHAICWWCVSSAVVITGLFGISLVRFWSAD